MAVSILIPLNAIFDDKGIKEAQAEFAKLGKSMKGLLGAAGIAVGLGAVVSGLKAAASAAAEDNKSQALLATQLQNTVGATDQQIAATERSISAMQMQASVADDTIRPALAALVRATGDLGDATQLTSLALDVSAGTGKDVQSVAIALGKAYQGNTAALTKMGLNVKGMKDPLGQLAKEFEGTAKAAAETDPMQRLEIIFGELAEQVGIALLPALNEFADWMADPVHAKEAQNLAQTIGGAFGTILTEVAGLIEGLAVVGWSLDNLFKNPMEVFKVLGMTIGEGYDYIMKKQNEAMKNGQKTAPFIVPDYTGVTGGNYKGGTVSGGQSAAQKKAEAAAKAAAAAAQEPDEDFPTMPDPAPAPVAPPAFMAPLPPPAPEPVKVAGIQTRTTWEYEVTDIQALFAARPDLVTLEPNPSAIRAALAADKPIPGLRYWQVNKATSTTRK